MIAHGSTGKGSPSAGPFPVNRTITLSDTAEKYLANLADALETGSVELWQLPPSLMTLYTYARAAGVETGKQSRQPEIDRLNAENDSLYVRAFNTAAQVKQIQQNRVDEGLAAYAAEFFADPITENKDVAA